MAILMEAAEVVKSRLGNEVAGYNRSVGYRSLLHRGKTR